jgi:hypothetical protein
MYAILGVWRVDADKQPTFDKSFLLTLVHEFAHSYVNPLVDHFPAPCWSMFSADPVSPPEVTRCSSLPCRLQTPWCGG